MPRSSPHFHPKIDCPAEGSRGATAHFAVGCIRVKQFLRAALLLALVLSAFRCTPKPNNDPPDTGPAIEPIHFGPVFTPFPLDLVAARGEQLGFAVHLRNVPKNAGLRIGPFTSQTGPNIATDHASVYRLVRVPAPEPDPDFIRHTGLPADRRELPPALLPLERNKKGITPVGVNDDLVWIDVSVPTDAGPGDYTLAIELAQDAKGRPIASAPATLHVYDFVLPADKHLHLSGNLDWTSLAGTYPGAFNDIPEPWLLSRTDPRGHWALAILDEVEELARTNRVALQVPRVQPVVKLPPGQPPLVEWQDYDSVIGPWLTDRDYLELPTFEAYDRIDTATRAAYWQEVIGHFDRNDWLPKGALVDDRGDVGATLAESFRSSTRNQPSTVRPPIRILTSTTSDRPAPGLLTRGPLLVSDVTRPAGTGQTWLSAKNAVVTSESDMRTLAFLAAARNAPVVRFGSVFAASTNLPATQAPWFYPGKSFGVDHPVESLAIKWARRAEQDFEYVRLARQRGQTESADLVARLTARPLAAAGDPVDWPLTGMMAGTVNPDAFPAVQKLLAQLIESTEPARRTSDSIERLQLDQARWLEPQERPLVEPTETLWTRSDNALNVELRALVAQPGESHNASGVFSFGDNLPANWRPGPAAPVPPLSGRVTRERTTATINLDALPTSPARQLLDLKFLDGYTRQASVAHIALPVAGIAYRPETAIVTDGSLADWASEDLLHTGPLTAFVSRPSVQSGDAPEGLPADLYATYDDRALHFAFRLADMLPAPARPVRNSVDYRDGRAWGEDLCQFLFQPVYSDGTSGPLIHVVVKPSAQWVESRTDGGGWRPAPDADITYAASINNNTWSGELAVPLAALRSRNNSPIAVLKFNFARHLQATAQSASYAGPVDVLRDSPFMGALVLRR